MRTVRATRYVTPLREGGSLPAIVEGDDDGLYVAKFAGAGHGEKALVAELVVGELARAAGLRVPELVLLEVEAPLGRNEPDSEIRELLRRSVGTNVGLDYLPGSVTFDPIAGKPPAADEAAAIVWLDALAANVDRTPRNPNLLVWHRNLWLIDHGSSLYFHHSAGWEADRSRPQDPFPHIKDHVLLRYADALREVDAAMARSFTADEMETIAGWIPDPWLTGRGETRAAAEQRADYVTYLTDRLSSRNAFIEEALRAR